MTAEQQLAAHIQSMGENLAHRLGDLINAGGDVNSTVQATELFVRAIVEDCLVRCKILAVRDYD